MSVSLLRGIAATREELIGEEQVLREAVLRYAEKTEALNEKLDTQMVTAVEWGGLSRVEVSRVAGYKSHAAVRDAKRRIEKREAEVR